MSAWDRFSFNFQEMRAAVIPLSSATLFNFHNFSGSSSSSTKLKVFHNKDSIFTPNQRQVRHFFRKFCTLSVSCASSGSGDSLPQQNRELTTVSYCILTFTIFIILLVCYDFPPLLRLVLILKNSCACY